MLSRIRAEKIFGKTIKLVQFGLRPTSDVSDMIDEACEIIETIFHGSKKSLRPLENPYRDKNSLKN